MFGKGFKLFRVFGFTVKADWSWPIIVVLVAWSLAVGLFPSFLPDLPQSTYLWMGVVGALGLFLSVVLHELGHSLVARRYGVEMRGITLFIFGGVAEMRDEPPSPVAEFMIAIAGPIVSVAIGVVCLAAGWSTRFLGLPAPVYAVLFYLGVINLVLVAFNMIPAFPLDGGRALRAALWRYKDNLQWATKITAAIGSAFGIFLIVGGAVNFIGGNFIGGMWWFLLGMFLNSAAKMSYQQVVMRSALAGEPVRRFMQSNVQTAPPATRLDEFVDDYVYRHHFKMYPVTDNGALHGCVTVDKLKQYPRDQWPLHTVAELAEPCTDENTISADADAAEALAKMGRNRTSRLMVVDHGRLQGVIALRDLLDFISLKTDIEGSA